MSSHRLAWCSVPAPEVAAELGIEDTARLEHEAKLHTPVEGIGAVARRANAQSLALVRLRPPPVFDLQITSIVGNDFDGTIIVAKDGDELEP